MKQLILRSGWILTIAAFGSGCAAPRILGKTTLVDDTATNGAPASGGKAAANAGTPTAGVTVNFINLGASLEDSVVSVVSDAKGEYKSPELPPGKYTVEAMYPGYVIGKATVELKKHGAKKAPFALRKIRETKGRSLKESETENIPTPGEVKIHPPE
jgi:hypothetical protein